MTPEVSIVVPTLNAMGSLPALLDAIDAQDDDAPREVVVVDSGSTDGTRELAAARAARLIQVETFDHGDTRNRAIRESRGALVVLTVQDALPLGADWLRRLLRPLRQNPRVAAVFARQVPRADAHPVVKHNLSRWVASAADGRVSRLTATEFQSLPPLQRLERCAFDNVCSALRRDVWLRRPFNPAPIAEDLEWGRDVLLDGGLIAYVPEAVVEHSHDRPALYELKRTWVLHQRLFHLFGIRTIPDLLALARAIVSTAMLHRRCVSAAGLGPREQMRGAALAVAWPLGQFLGGWTAAIGRDGWRPRGV